MTDTALDDATLTDTVDTHLDAYGEADAARRNELIARVWATDGRLLDPPLDGHGHGHAGILSAHFQTVGSCADKNGGSSGMNVGDRAG